MKACLWGLLFFASTSFALPVPAGVMAVVDLKAIGQLTSQLKQLREQYTVLRGTYDTAVSHLNTAQWQLEKLKELKALNSGSYNFGKLMNTIDDLDSLKNSADSWAGTLQEIAGGNHARFVQLAQAYEKSYPLLSESEYKKNTSLRLAQNYKQARNVNKAVSVETTYVFNQINHHLKKVQNLSQQIDKAPNTKAAIDLNSRLNTEIAYILMLNLKQQTLISQQLAHNGAQSLIADSEIARFHRLPDKA